MERNSLAGLFLNLLLLCFYNLAKCNEIYFTTEETDGFKIHRSKQINRNDWIAKSNYNNDINNTGFAYLEVETNPEETDVKQALHAGIIEGSLTHELIYYQWKNTIEHFCKVQAGPSGCDKVQDFVRANTKWVGKQVELFSNDPYWQQVKLFYAQIEGMFIGYNTSIGNSDHFLAFDDILWMSIYPDIDDLNVALGGELVIGSGRCSVLVKVLHGYKDIYFGHNTWEGYQQMLKMLKKYILPFKLKGDQKVPGHTMTFSTVPGSITSQDDFYLISSGLAVTETTNQVFNKALWKYVKPKNTVLESVRSLVANRMAISPLVWKNVFKMYNSGTYNNQWMILDYKNFFPGKRPKNNTFWVIEQIPSKIRAEDQTDVLINNGYWGSYNIPYYTDIYDISGYNEKLTSLGTWFSHSEAPRAEIFRRDHGKVVDMDSFMDLMRSNDFNNDPYAKCNCTRSRSAAGAISARNDLNVPNGNYAFKGQGWRPTGATDAKITNFQYFRSLQFRAVVGPTTGTNNALPPFKWSTSNFTNTPHLAHPDEWNFSPITYTWKF